MPGMNGCALIKHLRETQPGTPVAVMTAYGKAALAEASCIDVGLEAVLPKPLDPAQLIAVAKDLVGK